MHRSLLWGSYLSLLLPLCIIVISYSAGTSSLPQDAPPGGQATNGLDHNPGNFSGTCRDIAFDGHTCILSATCKHSKQGEVRSQLNLNKCLFYGKIPLSAYPPTEKPWGAHDRYDFYWYGKDKNGKVDNYNVDQYRFRYVHCTTLH